jgi:UDP-GlcNAc:undecaprenyl-phosphate GlcNAc-1-phosphate transferase
MTRVAAWTGAVDRPTDARRMHVSATPLLGGLAIYCGVMIPILTLAKLDNLAKGILIGGTIVTIVGFVEVLIFIRPLAKFAGQLVAIAVALAFDLRVTRLGIPLSGHVFHLSYPVSVIFTVLWIATIINMVNFIDGLDGLAAGVCAISALTFSIIAMSIERSSGAIVAAILGGSTFAFLRFNFHPASIFMGDAGSMLLGFVLAVLSVQSLVKSAATVALLLPLLVLGIPFADLLLVVFRRWRRGVPFYSPGQDHVHHDLVLVAGFSQRKSVLLLYGWCLLLNGLALAMKQGSTVAIIIFGIGSAVATVYMTRLLTRYRRHRPGVHAATRKHRRTALHAAGVSHSHDADVTLVLGPQAVRDVRRRDDDRRRREASGGRPAASSGVDEPRAGAASRRPGTHSPRRPTMQ